VREEESGVVVSHARRGRERGKEGEGEPRTHRDERTLAERHDPVLVPEEVEQARVVRALEVRHLERVVARRVHAKVLDLVLRDRLVLGRALRARKGERVSVSVRLSERRENERTSGYVRKAPISTLPAETVRFGSICVRDPRPSASCTTRGAPLSKRASERETHNDGEERVLELLVRLLRHDVDA